MMVGTTVTVGQSTGTNQNVFIDSDSVDIRRGSQVTVGNFHHLVLYQVLIHLLILVV